MFAVMKTSAVSKQVFVTSLNRLTCKAGPANGDDIRLFLPDC